MFTHAAREAEDYKNVAALEEHFKNYIVMCAVAVMKNCCLK